MSSNQETLSSLNLRIGTAETDGDSTALDEILAPVFAFRRANGICVDRKTFLEGVAPSAPRQTDIHSISFLGHDRALVTCVVSMTVEEVEEQFHNARLFVRLQDAQWKLLGWANEPL